jgi:hypothetical protein
MKIAFVILVLLCQSLRAERSIHIILRTDYRGECEFAKRIQIACQNLGWQAHISDLSDIDQSDYDWQLTLTPGKKSLSSKNDYLVLFDPVHHFFDSEGNLLEEYHNYAGYLTTYPYTANSVYPKRWYPTVQYQRYKKVLPHSLFYFIGSWGNRYEEAKYITLQKELENMPYTHFFGTLFAGEPYPKAFRGPIAYDGQSVLDLISSLGICLVLHSDAHLQHAVPSGRIFEAAAASSVIICDKNPFVMEHFQDSVLYVDQNRSGLEMFKQIHTYVKWIQKYPDRACKMAKKAHEIFEEKFLLETQLLDFDQFHQSKQASLACEQ